MNEIKVVTSDSKIWNLDILISDAWQNITKKIPLTLHLCAEGPCCQSCGLDDVIHNILDRSGYHSDDVVIVTSNQLQSSRYKEVRTSFAELSKSQQIAAAKQSFPWPMTNKFGMFIGRSNWKRLGLAAHLWRNHKHTCTMSYHFDPNLDFFRNNFGLEDYLYENWNDFDICNFLKNLPIKSESHEYPILWNDRAFDLENQYRNFFCDIVCETYFSGNTFFVTEKTWRPIIYRRPFVVQGPQWYLENLRRLGFRTFSDWWSEGYDHDINGGTLDSIKACIDYIAGQDYKTILTWYREMQPVLDHNWHTLLNLTDQKIKTTQYKNSND